MITYGGYEPPEPPSYSYGPEYNQSNAGWPLTWKTWKSREICQCLGNNRGIKKMQGKVREGNRRVPVVYFFSCSSDTINTT